jgi:hypothetical protein
MRPSYSEKTDRADLDPEYRPLAPGPKCGKLQVIVQLQQLSDLGVAISIDDFGTGFSFLSYVKRLPVRALVCGRHIFGRHFPFRVAELRDARARGGKPRGEDFLLFLWKRRKVKGLRCLKESLLPSGLRQH